MVQRNPPMQTRIGNIDRDQLSCLLAAEFQDGKP
jgi:hypothetical protein